MRNLGFLAVSLLLALSLGTSGPDAATKKKITHKRSDFTAEQREKMMEEARKICKKRYGSSSRVYKIDYYKWIVICTE